jgi:hypothetical protein
VQVQYLAITPNAKEEIRWIQGMRPATISWGNIIHDYAPETFHRMAAACGVPETAHLMHSTMWTRDVKGTAMAQFGHDSDISPEGIANAEVRVAYTMLLSPEFCMLEYSLGVEASSLVQEQQ